MNALDEAAPGSVASLLRGLRARRGLTIRALARESGISRSALSLWESRGVLPRAPELDRVLDTLGVALPERVRAFSLLDAPRGAARVDELVFGAAANPTVLMGALLRAIRRRAGWTQQDAADLVGVSQVALVHWEHGERTLDRGAMRALCQALGATAAETETLAGGPADIERAARVLFPSGATLSRALRHALFFIVPEPEIYLKDAQFAIVASRLWSAGQTRETQRRMLGNCFADYADHLLVVGDHVMASRCVERAVAIQGRDARGVDSRVFIFHAEMLARKGDAGRREALSLLTAYQQATEDTAVANWVRSVIARILFALGDPDRALRLATAAYREERNRNYSMDARIRARELARLLVRVRRADEALELLSEEPPGHSPFHDIQEAIGLAEVRHAAGDPAGARQSLEAARSIIRENRYGYVMWQVERAQRKLGLAPA